MTDVTQNSVGRPRNPAIDDKVLTAALEQFGEAGWAAFSVEAVARRAGVSKRSIYRRWADREALLTDALDRGLVIASGLDGDTLRDDMIALARAMLELYLGPAGKAAIRISLDEPDTPEFAEIRTALRSSQITASRAVVYRAVVRGELPENTSATLLLNTICGGAIMYAFSALPDTRACAVRAIASYSEELVDFVLARVPGR